MPGVLLVDTSVFLNVLDVPGFNQQRSAVLTQLQRHINDTSVSLLLPLCAIIETGNHISHITDGRLRRDYASLFVGQVLAAMQGEAPWQAMQSVDLSKMAAWLPEFPDYAMREIGVADLAIIKEFEDACSMYPRHNVAIWTLDQHMSGYSRQIQAR